MFKLLATTFNTNLQKQTGESANRWPFKQLIHNSVTLKHKQTLFVQDSSVYMSHISVEAMPISDFFFFDDTNFIQSLPNLVHKIFYFAFWLIMTTFQYLVAKFI